MSKQTRRPPEDRFWEKVTEAIEPSPNGWMGCWEWTASVDAGGYGQFGQSHIPGDKVNSHRWAYEFVVGVIPKGLQIDHLCKNRRCVNPAHMEPVTLVENVMRGDSVMAQNARKTHCKYGHPLSGDNLYVDPKRGFRKCRQCRTDFHRAKRVGYDRRLVTPLYWQATPLGLSS